MLRNLFVQHGLRVFWRILSNAGGAWSIHENTKTVYIKLSKTGQQDMMENEIEQMNINRFNLLVSEPFTTCLLDLVMSAHQHVSVHSSFCVDTWKHLQPRFSLIVSKASVANDIHDDLKEFERYVSN
jgi:hypothetical protein